MADLKQLAQELSDHIIKESAERWPGATLLNVIDGSGQITDGYVWCDLAGTTVRCIVPSIIDITGNSQIIYAVPLGNGSNDFICIGLAWNGLDNSRLPRIRAAAISDINGNPISGPSAGTVTSVALSASPAGIFDVSGSPITASGTLALSMDNQSANTVLRGPTSGGAGAPAFGSLVAADIPDISATYVQMSLFDAHAILAATVDNTPASVTITEQTVLGRATGGNIAALAIDSDLSAVSANDDTIPSAKATKSALDGKAASSHNHAASDINSGTLVHERGGIEADISAVAEGDLIVGTGAGTMALLAASGASDGDVPTIQADGSLAFEAIPASGGGSPVQVNLIPNSGFDVWENGIALAPDAWTLTGASATVARSTTTKVGLYSAAVTRAGTDCHLSQDIYIPLGSTYIRGREYTLGAWVYATVADRARLRVTDGTTTWNSSYHTGGSAWEWLSVTFTPGAAITQLTVGGAVDTGNTTANFDAFTIAEGATLTYQSPGMMPFSGMPTRSLLFYPTFAVVAGNALAVAFSGSIGTYAYQNTPANADSTSCTFWLRSGTYTLYVFGITNSSYAKVDWYLDNVLQSSGQNWYSAVQTYNAIKTLTLTVTGDGLHILKSVVNGKDAASSDYFLILSWLWIRPAAD